MSTQLRQDAPRLPWGMTGSHSIPLESVKARQVSMLSGIRELDARIIAAGKFVCGPLCASLEVALQETLCVAGRVVLTRSGHLTKAGIGWEVAYKHPDSEYVAHRNGAGSYACRMPAGGTRPAYDATGRPICVPAWAQPSDGQVEHVVTAMHAFFAGRRADH